MALNPARLQNRRQVSLLAIAAAVITGTLVATAGAVPSAALSWALPAFALAAVMAVSRATTA